MLSESVMITYEFFDWESLILVCVITDAVAHFVYLSVLYFPFRSLAENNQLLINFFIEI